MVKIQGQETTVLEYFEITTLYLTRNTVSASKIFTNPNFTTQNLIGVNVPKYICLFVFTALLLSILKYQVAPADPIV